MSKQKQEPIKPTTKASYCMQKSQTSNRFEVLGKPSQPSSSNPQKPVYYTKESRLLLQIIEPDHISVSGEIAIKKIFQNEKYFISNEILKTRKLYEFILVDTESVQISHVQNPEGNGIAYSKCKILKILNEKYWDQNIFTHKRFSEHFDPRTFDFYDYKNAWYHTFCIRPNSHSWFFNWMKKCKKVFQTGFRNGGYLWVPPQIFYVLKSKNLLIMSKPTVIASSLMEIAIHFSFVLNLESLGFYVGIFVPTKLNQAHSLSIWLGNSKSNGGPLSKSPKPKHLKLSKNGLKPKIPNLGIPQNQRPRYQFGPNIYQAQFPGPNLKTHFLQIQLTGPISKKSNMRQQRLCPSSLTQSQTPKRRIQQTAQPSSSKTKTCASVTHTLPLSNGDVNIFKSLCLRECTGSKIPRDQTFMLSSDRFDEEWKIWSHKWCDSILDHFKKKT